jgi:hypothetical protein
MSSSPWALLPAKSLDTLALEGAPEDIQPRFNDRTLETDFVEATTMRDQVEFLWALLRELGPQRRASFGNIAKFFGIGKGNMTITVMNS